MTDSSKMDFLKAEVQKVLPALEEHSALLTRLVQSLREAVMLMAEMERKRQYFVRADTIAANLLTRIEALEIGDLGTPVEEPSDVIHEPTR